jgi:primosomal protein N''
MFTKDQDKLVEVIKQPDLVIEQTVTDLKVQLESSLARMEIKMMEVQGLQQEIDGLEAKIAKCAELGIVEKVEEVVDAKEIKL